METLVKEQLPITDPVLKQELMEYGKAINELLKSGQSRVRVYRGAPTQVIVGEDWRKVEFNVEDFDSLSEYDHVTNHRFTAISAGYCMVVGQILMLGLAAGEVLGAKIYKSGVHIAQSYYNVVAGTNCVNVSDVTYLNGTTDFIELFVMHSNAGILNIHSSSISTFMAIHRLS